MQEVPKGRETKGQAAAVIWIEVVQSRTGTVEDAIRKKGVES